MSTYTRIFSQLIEHGKVMIAGLIGVAISFMYLINIGNERMIDNTIQLNVTGMIILLISFIVLGLGINNYYQEVYE